MEHPLAEAEDTSNPQRGGWGELRVTPMYVTWRLEVNTPPTPRAPCRGLHFPASSAVAAEGSQEHLFPRTECLAARPWTLALRVGTSVMAFQELGSGLPQRKGVTCPHLAALPGVMQKTCGALGLVGHS